MQMYEIKTMNKICWLRLQNANISIKALLHKIYSSVINGEII